MKLNITEDTDNDDEKKTFQIFPLFELTQFNEH